MSVRSATRAGPVNCQKAWSTQAVAAENSASARPVRRGSTPRMIASGPKTCTTTAVVATAFGNGMPAPASVRAKPETFRARAMPVGSRAAASNRRAARRVASLARASMGVSPGREEVPQTRGFD